MALEFAGALLTVRDICEAVRELFEKRRGRGPSPDELRAVEAWGHAIVTMYRAVVPDVTVERWRDAWVPEVPDVDVILWGTSLDLEDGTIPNVAYRRWGGYPSEHQTECAGRWLRTIVDEARASVSTGSIRHTLARATARRDPAWSTEWHRYSSAIAEPPADGDEIVLNCGTAPLGALDEIGRRFLPAGPYRWLLHPPAHAGVTLVLRSFPDSAVTPARRWLNALSAVVQEASARGFSWRVQTSALGVELIAAQFGVENGVIDFGVGCRGQIVGRVADDTPYGRGRVECAERREADWPVADLDRLVARVIATVGASLSDDGLPDLGEWLSREDDASRGWRELSGLWSPRDPFEMAGAVTTLPASLRQSPHLAAIVGSGGTHPVVAAVLQAAMRADTVAGASDDESAAGLRDWFGSPLLTEVAVPRVQVDLLRRPNSLVVPRAASQVLATRLQSVWRGALYASTPTRRDLTAAVWAHCFLHAVGDGAVGAAGRAWDSLIAGLRHWSAEDADLLPVLDLLEADLGEPEPYEPPKSVAPTVSRG